MMITAFLFTLAAAFPVTIRVDAGRPLGEIAPDLALLRCRRAELRHMKDGQKLLAASAS